MTEGFQPRRRGGAVATFSGFEADLLRSLASQLIELLRDEAAVPTTEIDPFEAMLDFSGPTNAPEDPVLARLFPSATPRPSCAAARRRPPAPSSTCWRRPGCLRSSTRTG
jgi:hypothetical protein